MADTDSLERIRKALSFVESIGSVSAIAVEVADLRSLLAREAALREECAKHKRMADILFSTMQLVRQYPDFDGRDGEENVLGDAMDAAMRGEVHETVRFIAEVRSWTEPTKD